MAAIIPVNDPSVQILPTNIDGTILEGYITVHDEDFGLIIQLESLSTLSNATFTCEWKLKNVISGYEDVLTKKLQLSRTLVNFIDELKTVIKNCLEINHATCDSNKLFSVKNTSMILKELESIGFDKVAHLSDNISTIKFLYEDSNRRKHFMTIIVDEKNLSHFDCVTDLPANFEKRHKFLSGRMQLIYDKFSQVVESFQCFWDNMKEIDDNCWVLEPEDFTFGCTYKRITLDKNISAHIQFNAVTPNELPEIRLLGPENLTKPLRETMTKNQNHWDISTQPYKNLGILFEIELPSPKLISKDEILIDCGICYSYRLEDEIPEVNCDNLQCSQIYHTSCLIEWLRSLTNCRQSFNVIFGECPYCNKSLMVNMK